MTIGEDDRDDSHERRAEIIERLYDVAIDPVRFEELLDAWEGHHGRFRQAEADPAISLDREYETHFDRASVFLDRFEASSRASGYIAALNNMGHSAAFVADTTGRIIAANPPAQQILQIRDGDPLAALPLDPEDADELATEVRSVALRRRQTAATLRVRPLQTNGPLILRILPVAGQESQPLAIVVSTAMAWPAGFDQTIRDAFGLTQAEVEVVRGLAEAKTVREIADERDRSLETVRTQIRSILAKTETHSQPELLRITLALMDVVAATMDASTVPVAAHGPLQPIPFETFELQDGRRLDYIQFGSPAGRPCLYLHMDYGLIRWPADIEAAAALRGLRIIAPIRPGYGATDPMPPVDDYTLAVCRDFLALLDHVGMRRVAVLSLGADVRYAMQLAILRPQLVSGILACGGTLPFQTPQQYERLDKWQRFILANARYAPRILPFLVKAGFSLARRVGKVQFFRSVNAGSRGDLATFDDPLVREAMLLGSEVSLSATFSAHGGFSREAIDSERDWSHLPRKCPAPVHFLNGSEDPQAPEETMRELAAAYPQFTYEFVRDAGQLVFFKERWRALDLLRSFLPD